MKARFDGAVEYYSFSWLYEPLRDPYEGCHAAYTNRLQRQLGSRRTFPLLCPCRYEKKIIGKVYHSLTVKRH